MTDAIEELCRLLAEAKAVVYWHPRGCAGPPCEHSHRAYGTTELRNRPPEEWELARVPTC